MKVLLLAPVFAMLAVGLAQDVIEQGCVDTLTIVRNANNKAYVCSSGGAVDPTTVNAT